MNSPTTFTVFEPTKKHIADITDEHYNALDRNALIALAKEFQSSLISLISKNTLPRVEDIMADKSYIPKTNIKDLPFEHNVPLVMDVMKVNGDHDNMEIRLNGSEVCKISVPRNSTWKGIVVQVGDLIKVMIKDTGSVSSPFRLSFLKYIENDPKDGIREPKTITRNKDTQTWHRWQEEHLRWLNGEASKGRPINSILAHIQRKWHDATIGAVRAQLAKMGYSVLRGIPVPKGKKKLVWDAVSQHDNCTIEEEIEIIKSFVGDVS